MRISEWSSDVCSSDLPAARDGPSRRHPVRRSYLGAEAQHDPAQAAEAEAPRRSRLSRAPSMSLRLVFIGTPDLAVPVPEEIGRAHVCTPVTNAHLVCRLLLYTQTSDTLYPIQYLFSYVSLTSISFLYTHSAY